VPKALFGSIIKKVGNTLTIELDNGKKVRKTAPGFKFRQRVQVAMNWESGRVRKVYPAKIEEDTNFPEEDLEQVSE
jgi:phosphopantothenoylcysteine synthetase/decarboxylase